MKTQKFPIFLACAVLLGAIGFILLQQDEPERFVPQAQLEEKLAAPTKTSPSRLAPAKPVLVESSLVSIGDPPRHLRLATPSIPTPDPDQPADLSTMVAFRDWIPSFTEAREEAQRNGQQIDPAVLEEGRKLAAERRPEMFRLIEENPWRSLHESLPLRHWVALPDEIRALVEEPISGVGDYEVRSDCRPAGQVGTPGFHTRYLTFGSQTAEAYVYGRREELVSKNDMPVQGIHLAGRIALWEDTVHSLDRTELPAALTLFQNGDPSTSLISARPLDETNTHIGLHGGIVHYFESSEERATYANAVAALESGHGPHTVTAAFAHAAASGGSGGGGGAPEAPILIQFAAGSATASNDWATTPKTILVARVIFSDQTQSDAPYLSSELTSAYAAVTPHIDDQSFGRTTLTPTVLDTLQILVLPNPESYYDDPPNDAMGNPQSGSKLIASDAEARATALGLNPENFDMLAIWSPPLTTLNNGLTKTAFAVVEGRLSWYFGDLDGRTQSGILHEHLHNYGLIHANSWDGYTGTGFSSRLNNREHTEYGDPFDIMGPDYGNIGGIPVYPNGHTSMNGKSFLGWIAQDEFHTVETSGTYRITRFDHPDANSGGAKLGLCVENRNGDTLWVGFRANYATATGNDAYIVWQNTSRAHRIIDTTPLSATGDTLSADREDGTLAIGETWVDPTGSVRITNQGTGGSSPQTYLDIQVNISEAEPYDLFTNAGATTPGLTGRYLNGSLRSTNEADWSDGSQNISGIRVDNPVHFPTSDWGERDPLNLTSGTDADWSHFSVQWDGFIRVNNNNLRLATISDDGSRMWIDSNNNGSFEASELADNNWGSGQAATQGDLSQLISPGIYPIRIQYEDTEGGNSFRLTSIESEFELYTSSSLTTEGLTGSYVATSLRSTIDPDWTDGSHTISGTRVEYPLFNGRGWGALASVGFDDNNGTDEDWDIFSVQWNGGVLLGKPMRFATVSDDGSRLWVTTAGSGFADNGWGGSQDQEIGPLTGIISSPGYNFMKIQYETQSGANNLRLFGVSTEPGDDHGNSISFASKFEGPEHSQLPGNIQYGEDNDYLSIEVPEAGQLRVYAVSGFDNFGYLYDAAGTLVVSNDDADGSYNRNFEFTAQLTEPGTYYIRVRAFSAAVTGEYVLHSEFTPGSALDLGVDQPGLAQNRLVTPASVIQDQGGTSTGGSFSLQNLINNAGLSAVPNPDGSDYESILANQSGGDWLSDSIGIPSYFQSGTNPDPRMVFSLPELSELSALVVWGFSARLTDEASDFTLEFSEDGGANYRHSHTVATSSFLNQGVATLDFGNRFRADTVRLTITNNAFGRGFSGGFGHALNVGIGNIKFLGSPADTAWRSFADESFDGTSAGRSADIGNNEESGFQQTFTGPGELCWWWKVSSELNFDRLRFYLNGVEQFNIHGEVDWARRSVTLPAGTHTARWVYTKDSSFFTGSDAGWVDQIQFTDERSDALDNPSWTLGDGVVSNPGWFAQSAVTKDGVDALQSDPVGNSIGVSQLDVDVIGPGTISFWWKTEAAGGNGAVAVFLRPLGGSLQFRGQIQGDTDWKRHTFEIPAGEHKVLWQYRTDQSGGSPLVDAAYLDMVSFTTSADGGELTRLPDGTRQITFPSEVGRTYSIEHSVDMLTWKRIQSAISSEGAEATTILPTILHSEPRGFFRVVPE